MPCMASVEGDIDSEWGNSAWPVTVGEKIFGFNPNKQNKTKIVSLKTKQR